MKRSKAQEIARLEKHTEMQFELIRRQANRIELLNREVERLNGLLRVKDTEK